MEGEVLLTARRSEREGLTWWSRMERLTRLYAASDGRCAICGRRVFIAAPMTAPDRATIDHIVSLANGGGSDMSNLQLACYPCNQEKGAK